MKKQIKKLTLNRETLRDLTTRNAGQVKGGTGLWCTATCKNCTHNTCAKCNGHTYNKKCGY